MSGSTVAASLVRHLSGEQQSPLAKRSTGNAAAYADYLRGRYYATRYTEDGFQKALTYLENAIDTDPAFALAYSGLADAYYDASNLILPPNQAMPRAKAAARKALVLDSALAEYHVSLGLIASKYDWNWSEAEKEFRTTLSLAPNLATAHQWYGLYRAQIGDTTRAIAELHRAQGLDPLSADIGSYLSTALYWARRYDEALRQAQRTIYFDPAYVPAYIATCWILEAQAKASEALAACRQAHDKEASPWTTLALARAEALAGQRAAASETVQDLLKSPSQFISGYDLAVVYASLGRVDEAFAALNDAFQSRAEWLGYLKIDPQADSLRSDPRFGALLQRLGL